MKAVAYQLDSFGLIQYTLWSVVTDLMSKLYRPVDAGTTKNGAHLLRWTTVSASNVEEPLVLILENGWQGQLGVTEILEKWYPADE